MDIRIGDNDSKLVICFKLIYLIPLSLVGYPVLVLIAGIKYVGTEPIEDFLHIINRLFK